MHEHPPDTSQDGPAGMEPASGSERAKESTGHSLWLMVACCAPMVLIALALFAGLIGWR